ncbi:MAG: hypothetical protein K2N23_05580 [Clostridia bacterium]|nr:hypothetical protein [Clostridia bacterium]
MKKIAGIIIAIATLVLCFTLSACGNKYSSNYSSSKMVEKNTSDTASVSFDKFSGTYVIKFNTSNEKASITYNATLKEGNIKVYYDFNDEKLDLFEIGTDGSVEGKTETFTCNKTIYIIIESDGKCREGSFSFTLEKSE